jgi:hypothetical protein
MKPTHKPSYSFIKVLCLIDEFKNDSDFLYQLNYLVLEEKKRYSEVMNSIMSKRFKSKLIEE